MICSPPELTTPEPEDAGAGDRVSPESWRCLGLLASVGDIDTRDRHAWEILVRVHGFDAVLRAVARCYWIVAPRGRVTGEQAKDVLDGRLPRALQHRGTQARRESRN